MSFFQFRLGDIFRPVGFFSSWSVLDEAKLYAPFIFIKIDAFPSYSSHL